MTRALARLAVRLSTWIAPAHLRARFREEWLAEIEERADQPPSRGLRRAAGAPKDALLARADAAGAAWRRAWNGSGGDARQAARLLARSPGHVAAGGLCLGIGMAVSVVVFSLVNTAIYGDLPGIADRQSLARLFVSYTTAAEASAGRDDRDRARPLAIADFHLLSATRVPSLASLAAEGDLSVAVAMGDRSMGTTAVFVSEDYFATLRTPLFAGRPLAPDDDRSDAPLVAVIGYHLWQERFDARTDIVGQRINVSGHTATVVGIAPPRFTGIQPSDVGTTPLDYAQLWLPLHHARRFVAAPRSDEPWLTVVGRIDAGSTLGHVQSDVQVVAARIARAQPDTRRDAAFVIRPHGFGPNDTSSDILIVIAMFLSVPLSVLAIGCANAANLQLSRAWSRNRELATRLALGGSRLQVVRVLALEALLLAVAAAAAGWAGALVAFKFIQPLFPMTIAVDARVLGFVLVLVAGTTLASGILPAWLAARRAAASSLKESAQGGGVGHTRLRNGLVIAQVALSLVLLIMSGLFVRSVRAIISDVPPALKEIAVASLDFAQIGATPAQARGLYDVVTKRIAADSRVRSVAVERVEILRYRLPGDSADRPPFVIGRVITPSWLDTMDARVLAGRRFDPRAPGAAIVNARFANELTNGQSVTEAVGKTIIVRSDADPARPVRIVGVVDDIPSSPGVEPDRALYLPVPDEPPTSMTLLVRTPNPGALTQDLRRLLAATVPELPIGAITTAETIYLRDTRQVMYMALTVGGFGSVAMVLAGWGLLAVISYSVSLRTREIGIRLAVGARPADVSRLILRQSSGLALRGIVAGLALAIPLALVLRAAFIGVSPVDPIAIALPCFLLLLISVVAASWPARRATRIDPATTLRDG